ncbi:ABC transporter permease [Ramlibacter sp. PS3R-8]|uniref:ABC transporter permease n=1 Tax=Ramlibacter sp. PS3R-8 TaxID=3133437 RepID=UPI0030B1D86E
MVAAARNMPIGKQFGASRRTSFEVTRSVWTALLLRESLTRLFSSRGAWFWLLAEPSFHIAYMMVIFTVVRIRHIGGIATAAWIMIGVLSFMAFRRTASQSMQAVNSNHALFTYRQVKPIDAVLTRALLEGVLVVVVTLTVMAAAVFFGVDAVPDDPITVMAVFLGMWLLGIGFATTMSIVVELAPEFGKLVNFVMTPLYFISGVIFPIASVPPPYREWVMLNPLAHGVEGARKAFAAHYHGAPETDIPYIYGFALVLIVLGLALHRVFAHKLVTR